MNGWMNEWMNARSHEERFDQILVIMWLPVFILLLQTNQDIDTKEHKSMFGLLWNCNGSAQYEDLGLRTDLDSHSEKNVATYFPDDLWMWFLWADLWCRSLDAFRTHLGLRHPGDVLMKAETFSCNYCCDSLLSPLTGSLSPQTLSPRSSDALTQHFIFVWVGCAAKNGLVSA